MRCSAMARTCWTALGLLLLGCQPEAAKAPPPAVSPAPVELATSLRVVCWNDYVTPSIAERFEKDFGVKVEIEIVNNNEEVIERLEKGESWDIWTPSDYAVAIAVDKGLLHPLDRTRIPNARGVGRRFQNASFDPELKHSVPFKWGTAGLGYDKKVFATPPNSWKVVFDPAQRKRLAGRISLLDDVREAMAGALISLGLDPNSTNEADYAKARDLLIAAKKDLAPFNSDDFYEKLYNRDVVLAHGWGGDIGRSIAKDDTLGFALPSEGYMLFIDNLAIPKVSSKKETAEIFINYLLRADISAQLASESRFASTIAAARELIAPEILASPPFQMPDGVPFHVFKSLGPATEIMDRYWQQVVEAP
jgi:spermidine/putrescine transport system substrate-binding protein